jgi:hypothetical protein
MNDLKALIGLIKTQSEDSKDNSLIASMYLSDIKDLSEISVEESIRISGINEQILGALRALTESSDNILKLMKPNLNDLEAERESKKKSPLGNGRGNGNSSNSSPITSSNDGGPGGLLGILGGFGAAEGGALAGAALFGGMKGLGFGILRRGIVTAVAQYGSEAVDSFVTELSGSNSAGDIAAQVTRMGGWGYLLAGPYGALALASATLAKTGLESVIDWMNMQNDAIREEVMKNLNNITFQTDPATGRTTLDDASRAAVGAAASETRRSIQLGRDPDPVIAEQINEGIRNDWGRDASDALVQLRMTGPQGSTDEGLISLASWLAKERGITIPQALDSMEDISAGYNTMDLADRLNDLADAYRNGQFNGTSSIMSRPVSRSSILGASLTGAPSTDEMNAISSYLNGARAQANNIISRSDPGRNSPVVIAPTTNNTTNNTNQGGNSGDTPVLPAPVDGQFSYGVSGSW